MTISIRPLHVVQSLRRSAGGPTTAILDLTTALHSSSNLHVALLSERSADEALTSSDAGVERIYCTSRSVLSKYTGAAFRSEILNAIDKFKPTHVHSHGLWTASSHWAARCAASFKLPLVIQPHGMLQPWALKHKAVKKRIALKLYQARDLEVARVLVASSDAEYECMRGFGLRQPIAVIPHGVRFSQVATPAPQRRRNDRRIALFLSRIHPVKGLPTLIEAWQRVRPLGWELVIAGPDEGGHLAEVKRLVLQAKLAASVKYVGEVHGQEKDLLFSSADLFVLPTLSENFGVVIAEALAHAVPVITTRGAPWKELEMQRCGWWVRSGVEPLVGALQEAMRLPSSELQEMGIRGRELARRFDWVKIGIDTADLYRWMIAGNSAPTCVRLC